MNVTEQMRQFFGDQINQAISKEVIMIKHPIERWIDKNHLYLRIKDWPEPTSEQLKELVNYLLNQDEDFIYNALYMSCDGSEFEQLVVKFWEDPTFVDMKALKSHISTAFQDHAAYLLDQSSDYIKQVNSDYSKGYHEAESITHRVLSQEEL